MLEDALRRFSVPVAPIECPETTGCSCSSQSSLVFPPIRIQHSNPKLEFDQSEGQGSQILRFCRSSRKKRLKTTSTLACPTGAQRSAALISEPCCGPHSVTNPLAMTASRAAEVRIKQQPTTGPSRGFGSFFEVQESAFVINEASVGGRANLNSDWRVLFLAASSSWRLRYAVFRLQRPGLRQPCASGVLARPSV